MMKIFWRLAAKYAWAMTIVALLFLVACSNVPPVAPPAAASKESNAATTVQKEPAALRTNEVFDISKDQGLLTIRYFFLDGSEASGDCILIHTPDGKTILIDAGFPEVGKQVIDYLNKLGVNTIDAAFNTHPHADHIGGYASVLQEKEVKAFYMENLPYPDSKPYQNVVKMLEEKKIPVSYPEDGTIFQYGDDLKIEVFNPEKGALPEAVKRFDYKSVNDQSMVLKLTYKKTSFLFTGDIYKDREFALIESKGKALNADFLHMPHHGNPTSSSNAFVEAVNPKIAVMSSNIFESPQIMKRYERNKVQAYATAFHGNILMTSDGEKINVITEKDRE